VIASPGLLTIGVQWWLLRRMLEQERDEHRVSVPKITGLARLAAPLPDPEGAASGTGLTLIRV
jgi:hypothetical protein